MTRWFVVCGVMLLCIGSLGCPSGVDPCEDCVADGGGDAGPGDGGWDCSGDPGLTFGAPITAPARTWTWVDFPDSFCMNGTTTGIGVNLDPASDRVMIYLQEGGACFNATTCATVFGQGGFGQVEFDSVMRSRGNAGWFDRDNPNNAMADWNMVFVPYCSGDVHAGSMAFGNGNRSFLGLSNMTQYLKRLVPTFQSASRVLLTGSSAGGFGATLNYDQTQRAFECIPVDMLNDSAAPMSDTYMRPCLQQTWRDWWDLGAALPAGCTDCSLPSGGGIVNAVPYLAARNPQSRFGLISSMEDTTIRTFFSFGYSPNCNTLDFMSGADFTAGLLELRDDIMGTHPNFGTFYVPGTKHVYAADPPERFAAGGSSLALWIERLVEGDPAWVNVGP